MNFILFLIFLICYLLFFFDQASNCSTINVESIKRHVRTIKCSWRLFMSIHNTLTMRTDLTGYNLAHLHKELPSCVGPQLWFVLRLIFSFFVIISFWILFNFLHSLFKLFISSFRWVLAVSQFLLTLNKIKIKSRSFLVFFQILLR